MRRVELFVFRHGETDWNKELRFQGHTDIPLNGSGIEQAEVLARKLRPFAPQVILSSDLVRARETARIANEGLGVPVIVSEKLRECQLGEAEGVFQYKITERFGPESLDRWNSVAKEDLGFGFPGGETKAELLLRLRAYLENYIQNQSEFVRIAISTHGGCLRRLIHYSQKAPQDRVPMPNCALYRLAHEGGAWHYLGMVD